MRRHLVRAFGWQGMRWRAGISLLVVTCAFLFAGASSASAGVGFSVAPNLGGSLKIGTAGNASSLAITNQSNGAEAGLAVTVNTISLVLTCGTQAITGADCPAASVDPGVLRPGLSGVGQPGTACAGTTFTIAGIDASEGKYGFTPSGGPVVLQPPGGSLAVCTIQFTVDVLKAPTKDADPAPGLQTDQVGFATGQASDGASGSSFGTSQVTISGPSTTSVYWDTSGNLAADPNPFGGATPRGADNVATGQLVLHQLSTGHDNLADGFQALAHTTTGSNNLALGTDALFANTTGSSNAASGYGALRANTTGWSSVATGVNALDHSIGAANTAVGTNSLLANTTGASNLALGNNAGKNLTTGSSNIDIGHMGFAAETRTIRVGTPGTQTAAFLAGVSGITVPGPTQPVVINPSGQLGTATSAGAASNQGGMGAQISRQQHEIDKLAAQNARLQKEIDQLLARRTHH